MARLLRAHDGARAGGGARRVGRGRRGAGVGRLIFVSRKMRLNFLVATLGVLFGPDPAHNGRAARAEPARAQRDRSSRPAIELHSAGHTTIR